MNYLISNLIDHITFKSPFLCNLTIYYYHNILIINFNNWFKSNLRYSKRQNKKIQFGEKIIFENNILYN
jgi:hypothetical protein